MQVYYYCSYSGSPVGFQLGSLTHKVGRTDPYELSRDNIHPFIRNCFERSTVQNGFGRLPETREYFMLFKKLRASGNRPEQGYYMNLAITTPLKAAYMRRLREEASAQDIAGMVRDSMVIKPSSPFGYVVDPVGLNTLLDQWFGSLLVDVDNMEDDDICLQLISSEIPASRVLDELGLIGQYNKLERVDASKQWVRLTNDMSAKGTIQRGRTKACADLSSALAATCTLIENARKYQQSVVNWLTNASGSDNPTQ